MNRSVNGGRPWLRFLVDLGLGVAALAFAFFLRVHFPLPWTADLLPPERIAFFYRYWPLFLGVQGLMLYFFGFYDPPRRLGRLDRLRGLTAAASFGALLLAGFFFLAAREFPRSVIVVYLPLDVVLLYAWRSTLARMARPETRRVAIVGRGGLAQEVAEKINLHHWHGLEVVGHVPAPGTGEEDPHVARGESPLGPHLGEADDLPRLLADGVIDDIILAADPYAWQTRLLDRLSGARPARSSVLLLPGPFESLIGRMRYRWVHDLPLIEVIRESEWRLHHPVKRFFDLTAGIVLLLLSLPLLLVCALLVKATSPGPVFYRQQRVGRGRRPITLVKLRTMRIDAEADGSEVLACRDDPRLTPIGALLRRYRLDELPQLFNVLAGSMSLVGPRPERPGFVERNLREIPGYAERFSLAPGLTGLAQVNGEYDSTAANKLRYDLAYLANWSLWLDLSILFRTIKIVLTSRGT